MGVRTSVSASSPGLARASHSSSRLESVWRIVWSQAVVGALVALLGSFGLLRLRSFFERVHAPAIIATLGRWARA